MVAKITPYDGVSALLAGADRPSYANVDDALRLAAYDLYDKIYWGTPGACKLISRGTENNPIYIPSAKTIIEATNRYLAVGFDYNVKGSPADVVTMQSYFDKLFRRENFFSKFATQKRTGLIRGDAMWHIVADDTKAVGNRISIYELHPGTYFPITDPDDAEKVIGCHIIQLLRDPKNPSTQIVKRQTYRRDTTGAAPKITSELTYWESDGWDDRTNPETLVAYQEPKPFNYPSANPAMKAGIKDLPPTITSLPVYHIRNKRFGTSPFGSSAMRGLERIAGAINQAISDEELALALDGIGLYATTSGPPIDEDTGLALSWVLGPGRVVEIAENSKFDRVGGVGSIKPSQDHLQYLHSQMERSSGVPDIAIGTVDVSVAESGIALALKMLPLLASNAESETEMLGIYDNMFYDLRTMWVPTYEGTGVIPDVGVDMVPVVKDPMPADTAAEVKMAAEMIVGGLWTVLQAQKYLEDKLGLEFDLSDPNSIIAEKQSFNAASDPFGARLNAEIAVDNPDPTVTT